MCRLLAYSCKAPRAVGDLLGPADFAGFRELSHLHRDGWGMAWVATADEAGLPAGDALFGSEGLLRASRSVLPAFEDPAFDELAHRRLGSAGFVHLRWATSGLAVTPSNTHPFLLKGWAFAHQGSIPSPDRLDSMLSAEWLARRGGTTDSEAYFLYLLQRVERAGDLVTGIRNAVTGVVERCGPASLNAVLLSPSSLVVVHGRAGLEAPRDDLLAAMGGPEKVPLDHLTNYFRLRYRRLGGELDSDVVVASSGVPGGGWTDVPEDSILHIDLRTRSLSFHAFETPAPVGARKAHL